MEMCFPPFRLDLGSEQLWREEEPIALRHKTLAVLCYLVEHSGKLVTKDELLDAVWAGTVVSDTVLKSCIRELRTVLSDDVRSPQYIATVHRRGYRFIGKVASSQHSVVSSPPPPTQSSALSPQHSVLVGRETELTQLQSWLDKALRGERQLVFVTGEAGIGKTALVDAFLVETRGWKLETGSSSPQVSSPNSQASSLWLGRGQCIEQYGAGEAYMPILEALGRLCREPGGEHLIALLNQHAPTWLVQMPTLLSPTELEALQRKVQGATRERMLREMGEAVDALTAERPLVLWLEDLHWSDPSTLKLLALLARRREPARLLVIGTYRPVEVIVKEHPLRGVKQELQLHGQCEELAVRLLSEEHIAAYLAARVQVPSPARAGEGQGKGQSPAALARLAHLIHARTEGNPLFMVNIVDDLLTHGLSDDITVKVSTPATIRQMIEQQLERLNPEDQHVLEVASVAGVEFSATTVAAGIEATVDEVEERCGAFARHRQFLRTDGTVDWPDGTVTTQYGFLHALYQEVTYERIPVGRRTHLHQRIGERTEAAYSKRASEIAAELALHFERGWDYPRAVQYLQQAGENAVRRSAHQEAISLLTKGLELLKTLPDTPERTQHELTLQLTLGASLMTTKGYAAPEVEKAYGRARELCQQLGETPKLFPAISGLVRFHLARGEVQTARELGEQCLRLARPTADPMLALEASRLLGMSSFFRGEFALARQHVEHGLALYDPPRHQALAVRFGNDPGVVCLCYIAHLLWFEGYPDQALARYRQALTLAQELAHPHSLASPLVFVTWLHQFRRDQQQTRKCAEDVQALAGEQGFALFLALGTMLRGWAVAGQGQPEHGMGQIQDGLAALRATGAELWQPYFLALLAEVQGEAGQAEEGLRVLDEAITAMDTHGECWWAAEIHRLKGQLVLQSGGRGPESQEENHKSKACPEPSRRGKSQTSKKTAPRPLTPDPQSEAEAYFFKALDIAQRQQAKSLELRATMSLARLWQQQGKQVEAYRTLSEIYNWFTEGFDTTDLQEAKALLDELS